jgi:hypothetical protein
MQVACPQNENSREYKEFHDRSKRANDSLAPYMILLNEVPIADSILSQQEVYEIEEQEE